MRLLSAHAGRARTSAAERVPRGFAEQKEYASRSNKSDNSLMAGSAFSLEVSGSFVRGGGMYGAALDCERRSCKTVKFPGAGGTPGYNAYAGYPAGSHLHLIEGNALELLCIGAGGGQVAMGSNLSQDSQQCRGPTDCCQGRKPRARRSVCC